MARRRALARVSGRSQQFPAGDALALAGALDEAAIVTLASAATVAIGAAQANTIQISGTTTITSFDTVASGAVRRLVFSGALTLTYNATSLILPGLANITTAAGDAATFVSLGGGNWRCVGYQLASSAGGGNGGGSGAFSQYFTSSALNITANSVVSVLHGLGSKPKIVGVQLVFTQAVDGFSVGDTLEIPPYLFDWTNARAAMVVYTDPQRIYVSFSSAITLYINRKNGSNSTTNYLLSSFQLILKCAV